MVPSLMTKKKVRKSQAHSLGNCSLGTWTWVPQVLGDSESLKTLGLLFAFHFCQFLSEDQYSVFPEADPSDCIASLFWSSGFQLEPVEGPSRGQSCIKRWRSTRILSFLSSLLLEPGLAIDASADSCLCLCTSYQNYPHHISSNLGPNKIAVVRSQMSSTR